jgi:hypothetical protein
LIWRIVIFGILQIAFDLVFGLVILPICSLALFVHAIVAYSIRFVVCIILRCIKTLYLRNIHDGLMFHAIIKKYARIPSNDGFIIRQRINIFLTLNIL